VFTSVKAAQ